jgi:hypothetical protein
MTLTFKGAKSLKHFKHAEPDIVIRCPKEIRSNDVIYKDFLQKNNPDLTMDFVLVNMDRAKCIPPA